MLQYKHTLISFKRLPTHFLDELLASFILIHLPKTGIRSKCFKQNFTYMCFDINDCQSKKN